jgi:hypothetical protein
MNIIERDLKMFCKTEYRVTPELMESAVLAIPNIDFRLTINQPTGKFFYDPWVIKPELKNTVWEKILNSLPNDHGEARIIILKPGTAYSCHADADDRWHLNLQSDQGYLIDLDSLKMYPLISDGIWYHMDAGKLHTAANFGATDRIQIVIRQLLRRNQLINPVHIKLTIKSSAVDFRYQFDSTISPWLNRANKQGTINSFKFVNNEVSFNVENQLVDELTQIVPKIFEVTV